MLLRKMLHVDCLPLFHYSILSLVTLLKHILCPLGTTWMRSGLVWFWFSRMDEVLSIKTVHML
jgi:hypothetical protein